MPIALPVTWNPVPSADVRGGRMQSRFLRAGDPRGPALRSPNVCLLSDVELDQILMK